jgi:ATP-binding cassette subfamily B protein
LHGRPYSAVRIAVRLIPRVGFWPSLAFGLSLLWNGCQPVLFTLAMGALVGSLPLAAREGLSSPAGQRVLIALAGVAILFVSSRELEPIQSALGDALARRYERLIQRLLLRAASHPSGIAHLEGERIANRLATARGEAGGLPPRYVVYKLVQVVPPYLEAAGSAVLLFGFRWWAPLVMLCGLIVERRWIDRELETVVAGTVDQTAALRRAGYFRDLALQTGFAKELRIFGLSDWVIGRFWNHWKQAMETIWRRRRGHGRIATVAATALTVAYGAVAVGVALAGAHGDVDVGQIAVFLGAAAGMTAIAWTADPEWALRVAAQTVAHAVDLDRELRQQVLPVGHPADGLPRREIRFEAVRFRYLSGKGDVLAGLDLAIPVGSSLAVVGRNGAGKTTLIKLLARLYDPTSGKILVDGIDLVSLDPASWRRRLAVIFQDFARYELPVRDNVGFGSPRTLANDPEAVERALRRAGAEGVVESLPFGLDTVLSRRFRGGSDLSGGQWQRIALARCFMAVEGGASVLVLDEPTASLDARAEAELFERFLEITHGLTTILISHRFSSARHADRIVVIDSGRVVEDGSHDELLGLGGLYATMFALQATRFRDDVEPEHPAGDDFAAGRDTEDDRV